MKYEEAKRYQIRNSEGLITESHNLRHAVQVARAENKIYGNVYLMDSLKRVAINYRENQS